MDAILVGGNDKEEIRMLHANGYILMRYELP